MLPSGHPSIKSAADLRVGSLAALEPGCTYRRIAESWARKSSALQTTELWLLPRSWRALRPETGWVMPKSVLDLALADEHPDPSTRTRRYAPCLPQERLPKRFQCIPRSPQRDKGQRSSARHLAGVLFRPFANIPLITGLIMHISEPRNMEPSHSRRLRLFSPILAGATLRERLITPWRLAWHWSRGVISGYLFGQGPHLPPSSRQWGHRRCCFLRRLQSACAAVVDHRWQHDLRTDGHCRRLSHS